MSPQLCIFALVVKRRNVGRLSFVVHPIAVSFSYSCAGGRSMQVTKGKNKQRKMEAMLRLVAQTSTPIEEHEKDELLLHMTAMYKVRIDPRGNSSPGR